jgi:hypothetical protein
MSAIDPATSLTYHVWRCDQSVDPQAWTSCGATKTSEYQVADLIPSGVYKFRVSTSAAASDPNCESVAVTTASRLMLTVQKSPTTRTAISYHLIFNVVLPDTKGTKIYAWDVDDQKSMPTAAPVELSDFDFSYDGANMRRMIVIVRPLVQFVGKDVYCKKIAVVILADGKWNSVGVWYFIKEKKSIPAEAVALSVSTSFQATNEEDTLRTFALTIQVTDAVEIDNEQEECIVIGVENIGEMRYFFYDPNTLNSSFPISIQNDMVKTYNDISVYAYRCCSMLDGATRLIQYGEPVVTSVVAPKTIIKNGALPPRISLDHQAQVATMSLDPDDKRSIASYSFVLVCDETSLISKGIAVELDFIDRVPESFQVVFTTEDDTAFTWGGLVPSISKSVSQDGQRYTWEIAGLSSSARFRSENSNIDAELDLDDMIKGWQGSKVESISYGNASFVLEQLIDTGSALPLLMDVTLTPTIPMFPTFVITIPIVNGSGDWAS